MSTIKIQKNIVYAVIITFVITFALTYFIFVSYPNMQQQSSINKYKKELFSSVLCQYSCPLTNQTINNKTQLLPSQDCVKQCTVNMKEIQNSTTIKNSDLENDNLITDIESVVSDCKIKAVNQTALTMNNELFFSCTSSSLASLKSKYSYLN